MQVVGFTTDSDDNRAIVGRRLMPVHHPVGVIGDEAKRVTERHADPGGRHVVDLPARLAVVQVDDRDAGDRAGKREVRPRHDGIALVERMRQSLDRSDRVALAPLSDFFEEEFHVLRQSTQRPRARRPVPVSTPRIGRTEQERHCVPPEFRVIDAGTRNIRTDDSVC